MPETETPSESYTETLLNRVEAIIDSGAGSVSELARFLLPEQDQRQAITRVAEWVRSRTRNPNGETALRMQEWAAKKTIEISTGKGSRERTRAYQEAFAKVTAKRK